MAREFETIVTDFGLGMTGNPRSARKGECQICEHFDAITDGKRLIPFRSAEDGDSSSATNQIRNFSYIAGTVYGLGRSGSPTRPAIFSRTNFTDATWSTNAANDVSGTTPSDADDPAFTAYHGALFGVRSTRYLWKIIPGGAVSLTYGDLTAYTTVAPGLVHSKDDCFYQPYDNKIARDNNGSFTAAVLTLPTDLIITSICEFGNFLAIACRPTSGMRSKVYLWDRDSSSATLSENIDWCEGNLMVLEELEGYLIGVSFEGTTGSYNLKSRMTLRYYAGGASGAVKFAEFIGLSSTPTGQGAVYKQKQHNRIYFPAAAPINTTGYFGIWSIGRSSTGGPFAVTLDRLYRTAFSGSVTLYGFMHFGDYLFSSYVINGAVYMDKTDDSATYTQTSVYESVIFASIDSSITKKLMGATAFFEKLPSGGSITMKYRQNGATSWTTLFTESTANTISHSTTVVEADSSSLGEHKEVEFRLESTGGAVPTGFSFKEEEIENRAY